MLFPVWSGYAERKGWSFHLGQSWWRKIQSLGLSNEYKDKESDIGKWLLMTFGLHFVSSDSIEYIFAEVIMSEAPSDSRCTSYADYLTVNYITQESKFPRTKPGKWLYLARKWMYQARKVNVPSQESELNQARKWMHQARKVSVPNQESECTKPGSECTKPGKWEYQARKVNDHVYSGIYIAQFYDIPGRFRNCI
jgi:hypothetical protein